MESMIVDVATEATEVEQQEAGTLCDSTSFVDGFRDKVRALARTALTTTVLIVAGAPSDGSTSSKPNLEHAPQGNPHATANGGADDPPPIVQEVINEERNSLDHLFPNGFRATSGPTIGFGPPVTGHGISLDEVEQLRSKALANMLHEIRPGLSTFVTAPTALGLIAKGADLGINFRVAWDKAIKEGIVQWVAEGRDQSSVTLTENYFRHFTDPFSTAGANSEELKLYENAIDFRYKQTESELVRRTQSQPASSDPLSEIPSKGEDSSQPKSNTNDAPASSPVGEDNNYHLLDPEMAQLASDALIDDLTDLAIEAVDPSTGGFNLSQEDKETLIHGVSVTSSILLLAGDEKQAVFVNTFGRETINIVDCFSNLSQDGLTCAQGLKLSDSLLSSAVNIFKLFCNAPDPVLVKLDVIEKKIDALADALELHHKYVGTRFDAVDSRLDEIGFEIRDGFEKVRELLRAAESDRAKIRESLASIEEGLDAIRNEIKKLDHNLRLGFQALDWRTVEDGIDAPLVAREQFGDQFSKNELRTALSRAVLAGGYWSRGMIAQGISPDSSPSAADLLIAAENPLAHLDILATYASERIDKPEDFQANHGMTPSEASLELRRKLESFLFTQQGVAHDFDISPIPRADIASAPYWAGACERFLKLFYDDQDLQELDSTAGVELLILEGEVILEALQAIKVRGYDDAPPATRAGFFNGLIDDYEQDLATYKSAIDSALETVAREQCGGVSIAPGLSLSERAATVPNGSIADIALEVVDQVTGMPVPDGHRFAGKFTPSSQLAPLGHWQFSKPLEWAYDQEGAKAARAHYIASLDPQLITALAVTHASANHSKAIEELIGKSPEPPIRLELGFKLDFPDARRGSQPSKTVHVAHFSDLKECYKTLYNGKGEEREVRDGVNAHMESYDELTFSSTPRVVLFAYLSMNPDGQGYRLMSNTAAATSDARLPDPVNVRWDTTAVTDHHRAQRSGGDPLAVFSTLPSGYDRVVCWQEAARTAAWTIAQDKKQHDFTASREASTHEQFRADSRKLNWCSKASGAFWNDLEQAVDRSTNEWRAAAEEDLRRYLVASQQGESYDLKIVGRREAEAVASALEELQTSRAMLETFLTTGLPGLWPHSQLPSIFHGSSGLPKIDLTTGLYGQRGLTSADLTQLAENPLSVIRSSVDDYLQTNQRPEAYPQITNILDRLREARDLALSKNPAADDWLR